MYLKRLGYYKELPYGNTTDPSILDHIDKEIANKKEICKYLQSGHILAACGGIVNDVICPEKGIVGSPDSVTDGVWTWHADLAYYVDKYDLLLDESFLEYIREKSWEIPNDLDIDYDNIQFI